MNNIKSKNPNLKILNQLNVSSKPDFKQISSNLKISNQTLKNKINAMREEKIITNYTININPNPPINLKYVFLEIKTNPKEPELVRKLLEISQLTMLDGIFGEFSLISLFKFKSTEEYYDILNRIDIIMAKSYFKKYQIIDTIKVFKINGIDAINAKIKIIRELDDLDYILLEILESKQSIKPLSTYEINKILKMEYSVNITQPTVYNRIKFLENSGVILNYSMKFNPKELGFDGKFIVRIKPKDPSKYDEIALDLVKNQNITDLFRIGEQYGLLAIVRVKKVEEYGQVIKELYDSDKIEDTWTHFVLDELKPYINF